MELIHRTSLAIGVLGVGVILLGVLRGLRRFVQAEWRDARGGNTANERRELRHVLGYYLLLGLEFLIAADIIDTLVRPETSELIALGAIVVIRTLISWSLNAELRHSGAAASERSLPI